jgi:hypothetical protein
MNKWVRFKGDQRYHAVYVEARGGLFFYCNRFRRESAVIAIDPRASAPCCTCCQSRIKLPYLIPEELRAIRAENEHCRDCAALESDPRSFHTKCERHRQAATAAANSTMESLCQ